MKNPFFLLKKCDTKEEKALSLLFKSHQNKDVKMLIYATQTLDQRKKFVSLLKKKPHHNNLTRLKIGNKIKFSNGSNNA